MQLSLLIGKKIVSPAGEELGYVTGAYLSRDLKSLSALTAADDEEEEFILPARTLQATRDVVIASKPRPSSVCGVPAPIGRPAYSDKGEVLGVVSDWLFGDCEPVFLVTRDGVDTGYAAETVAAGESVVIYLSGKRPAPKKREKQKNTPPVTQNEDTMSDPLPSENASEQISEEKIEKEPVSPVQAAQEPMPQRAELGSRSLLGRRVVRSVYDAQGGVVALAGDRITPEVLSRARKKGRLLALTVNTLTKLY